MATATPAQYSTRCRLCSTELKAAPYILSGSESDNARITKLFGVVTKHYQERHPDHLSAATFAGWNSDDPALQAIQETARAQMFAIARKNSATNEQIIDRCAKIGLSQSDIEKVSPLIFEMRDFLAEQGRFGPQPAPRPV